MNDSKRISTSIKTRLIMLFVEVATLVGFYYLYTTYNLPMSLLGASFLFVSLLLFTLLKFNSLDKPKRVFSVGLTLSFLILTVLFAYKHFVSNISITTIHVGVIVIAPILLWKYLEKKTKKTEM